MKKIIALGADSKSNFSFLSENGLVYNSFGKDLTDAGNFNDFEEGLRKHLRQNNIMPDCVVCDLHPDYFSTRLAKRICQENTSAEFMQVQHHFAHVVSCMADNDIKEQVIGISFDGAGLGADSSVWGGEFFLCTRNEFKRMYHLKYVPQPGGDSAAREGWRMAIAYLFGAYGENFDKLDLFLFKKTGRKKISIIKQMIKKEINSPLTSSAGRLFDAVSSLIGICDASSFEAEAAMFLEKEIHKNIKDYYEYEIKDESIDVYTMIRQITEDLAMGTSAGIISAKFHNTLGEIIFNVSLRMKRDTAVNKVLVSGGCFQNKYLVDYITERFSGSGLELFKHNKYSTTDLGISVGQAVIAEGKMRG